MKDRPKKILVLRFDTIGDIVLFSGVLDALLEAYPSAEITVMVMEKMKYIGKILNPKLKWWPVPAAIYHNEIGPVYSGDLDFESLDDIVQTIKKASFDLLVNPLYTQTFLGNYLSRASGIQRRIGFSSGDCFSLSKVPDLLRDGLSAETHTETVDAEEWSHEVEKNHLFIKKILRGKCLIPKPKVYIEPDASAWAQDYLKRNGLTSGGESKYAFFFPGAGYQYRTWPLDRFAEIAKWLIKKEGIIPVFAGSSFDSEVMESIGKKYRDRAGRIPLMAEFKPSEIDRFVALLSKARLYVGSDTGPMHIAAATGIPVVGVFGGGTWGRFFPYGEKCSVAVHELPCFKCGWNCIEMNYLCINLVKVETVKKAIKFALHPKSAWRAGKPQFFSNEDSLKFSERIGLALSIKPYKNRVLASVYKNVSRLFNYMGK